MGTKLIKYGYIFRKKLANKEFQNGNHNGCCVIHNWRQCHLREPTTMTKNQIEKEMERKKRFDCFIRVHLVWTISPRGSNDLVVAVVLFCFFVVDVIVDEMFMALPHQAVQRDFWQFRVAHLSSVIFLACFHFFGSIVTPKVRCKQNVVGCDFHCVLSCQWLVWRFNVSLKPKLFQFGSWITYAWKTIWFANELSLLHSHAVSHTHSHTHNTIKYLVVAQTSLIHQPHCLKQWKCNLNLIQCKIARNVIKHTENGVKTK